MKSHVFYILEVKENDDGKFEASLNLGNGKVFCESNTFDGVVYCIFESAYQSISNPNEAA